MKKLKYLLFAVLTGLGTSVFAQDKTESVKVYGNCEMCKYRIEKALKVDGVTKADWNVDSKVLTVSYDAGKVNFTDLQKRVAAAGHDTENVMADDSVYKRLPGCCRYERKVQSESRSEGKH